MSNNKGDIEVSNAEQLSDNIDLLTQIDTGSNSSTALKDGNYSRAEDVYTLDLPPVAVEASSPHQHHQKRDFDDVMNKSRNHDDHNVIDGTSVNKRLKICLPDATCDDEYGSAAGAVEQEQPVIDGVSMNYGNDDDVSKQQQSASSTNEEVSNVVVASNINDALINNGIGSIPRQGDTTNINTSANEEKWQKRLEQLKVYKEVNDNCLVPRTYAKNPQLGKWVKMQRFQYKLFTENKPSRLTPARIQQLNGIGFSWIVRSRKVTWDVRFEELQEYKKIKGNCLVPMRYAENPQLGRWIEVQRKEWKKVQNNEKSSLTAEHIQKLEEIGFVWRLTCDWDVRFQELKEYREGKGHCLVPRNYPKNQPLAYWVGHQRKEMSKLRQNKKSRLTNQRIEALDSIDFCWDASSGVSWEYRWEELLKFKQDYGHCLVRIETNPDLAKWCRQMRKEYSNFQKGKRSRLSAEKILEMENIGFIWSTNSDVKGYDENALYSYHEGSVIDESHVVTNELAIGTAAALAVGTSTSSVRKASELSGQENVSNGHLVPIDISMRPIDDIIDQPALESTDVHCAVNKFMTVNHSIEQDGVNVNNRTGVASDMPVEFEV